VSNTLVQPPSTVVPICPTSALGARSSSTRTYVHAQSSVRRAGLPFQSHHPGGLACSIGGTPLSGPGENRTHVLVGHWALDCGPFRPSYQSKSCQALAYFRTEAPPLSLPALCDSYHVRPNFGRWSHLRRINAYLTFCLRYCLSATRSGLGNVSGLEPGAHSTDSCRILFLRSSRSFVPEHTYGSTPDE